MKTNLKYLVILSILLLSCKNNNEDYLNIINENNANLKNEIEEFKQRLDIKHSDEPSKYNDSLVNCITKLSNDILNFNDVKKYSLLINELDKTAQFYKIKLDSKRIESDNQSILFNNLLLNLNKLTKLFAIEKFRFTTSTHCFFGELIQYEHNTIGDSVIIDFKTPNQFNIVIDSVVDNNHKLKYRNIYKSIIGQLKYKKSATLPEIYGKIFYTGENEKPVLIQRINK
ncbi:MAG: hypothetical protein V4548_00440 [Bacteroidota bacterium]